MVHKSIYARKSPAPRYSYRFGSVDPTPHGSEEKTIRVTMREFAQRLDDAVTWPEVCILFKILRRAGIAKRIGFAPKPKGAGRIAVLWEIPAILLIDLRDIKIVRKAGLGQKTRVIPQAGNNERIYPQGKNSRQK